MMRLSRDHVGFLVQIVLLLCFGIAASIFRTPWIVVLWMVVALSVGIIWQGAVAAAYSAILNPNWFPNYGLKDILRTTLIFAMGIASSILVANGDIASLNSTGLFLTGFAVRYYLPVGALFIGAVSTIGYVFGLRMFNRRPSFADTILMAVCALISVSSVYHGLFSASGEISLLSFLSSIQTKGPYWISKAQEYQSLYVAPNPYLGLPLEMIAGVIGSFAVALRERFHATME
jgi:hypothetical protein